jgi:DNA polymerase-1
MPAIAEPKATASSAAVSSASPRPLKSGDHVFLVDGSSYIFRAYFAMFKAAQARGKSFTRSDGLPVGAVMTFCNMLWKLLREGISGVKPSHIAVVFDHSAKSFRNLCRLQGPPARRAG